MVPTAGYAQVATTIAQLKAITAANRSPNFCLLLPQIGSWVYYSPTSTATADNVHVFMPADNVGRWLTTNQLPYFAAANNAANNAIATHKADSNPHPVYLTAADDAANNAIATHNADSNPHPVYLTAADNAANNAIATHNADSNPHPVYQLKSEPIDIPQQGIGVVPFSLRVAVGGGSAVVVRSPSNIPVAWIGSNSGNRGVITPGVGGLQIGGAPSEPLGFWGGNPVSRPNAITPPANNTADTRRVVLEIGNVLRALGLIAP